MPWLYEHIAYYASQAWFHAIETIRRTISFVQGLDGLKSCRIPRNYISAEVRVGKSISVDHPQFLARRCSRPFGLIYMDTFQTQTKTWNGHTYCTMFVDDYSLFIWAYTHKSTACVYDIFQTFLVDTAPLREQHGPLLCFRLENASVNVSQKFEALLLQHGICSETSSPYQP